METTELDHTNMWVGLPSTAERREAGRLLRETHPRSAMSRLAPRKRDAADILNEQNATRLPELVPMREERMAQSPFAYFRGSAAVMASDLAEDPHTEILVPSCGDAHLANFGFYASSERTLMFDLNDFDESAWAPWEWDLKRLVTSVVLAGQAASRDEATLKEAVVKTVLAYANALYAYTSLAPTERFYTHFNVEETARTLTNVSGEVLKRAIKQAKKRTGERAARKLTTADSDGRLRFVPAAPAMSALPTEMTMQLEELLRRYLEGASPEIQQLFRHYVPADSIRRVVGVGSVGTRCFLSLFQDGDGNTLILQSKEANRSVLEQYGGITQPVELTSVVAEHGEGARIVGMQRILQAASDPFLGRLQTNGIDLYVRQFHDMKGGIDAEELEDEPFVVYAESCAVLLARAHSQSPRSTIASGYIGHGQELGLALWEWSTAYAARVHEDHAAHAVHAQRAVRT